MQQHRTLVLDSNQRSALAVTRSLGMQGIEIVNGSSNASTLAGASKFSAESVVYASPNSAPDTFVSDVVSLIKEYGISTVLPMTDVTTSLLISSRDRLGKVNFPYPTRWAYDSITNKRSLQELSHSLGIPTPTTHYSSGLVGTETFKDSLQYPIVIKPETSKIFYKGEWIGTSVMYANSYDEIVRLYQSIPWLSDTPAMFQQYVSGFGQGLFALFERGEPITFFSHRRIRERPPSGGVSTLSESVPLDPVLVSYADKLLRHVGWHGLAMLEFRVSETGEPFLIEVNGRPWGSMQLAVEAGVDFPYMLWRIANGMGTTATTGYLTDLRNRWLLGDLDHTYLTMRDPRTPARERIRSLLQFLNFFPRRTRFEVLKFYDIKPFLIELRHYFSSNTS